MPERVLTKRFLRRYKFKREVISGGLSVYRSGQVDYIMYPFCGGNPSDNKPALLSLLKEHGARFVVCLGFAYSVDRAMAVGDVVFCHSDLSESTQRPTGATKQNLKLNLTAWREGQQKT